MATPKDEKPADYDDHYVGEWVTYGLKELDVYMKKVSRFEAFCRGRDETKENDEADPS